MVGTAQVFTQPGHQQSFANLQTATNRVTDTVPKTPLSGSLRKMQTRLDDIAYYTLQLDGTSIDMNAKIGETIKLSFDGTINCIACERVTTKSFGGGFCYPCFRNAPEASECIIRPELCRAHEGEARDMEWAENEGSVA